ncbi:MAG: hypothetical protein C4326_07740 [Ignavibacteria bacterium]
MDVMSEGTPRIYRELIERLAAVRKKEHLASLSFGTLHSLSVLLGIAVLAVMVEQYFYLSPTVRTALVALYTASAVALCAWFIGRPLLKLLRVLPEESNTITAAKVGKHFPTINDHLVNILQLYPERERSRFYSPALIDASFADVAHEIAPFDFARAISMEPVRKAAKMLGAVLSLAVALTVFSPQAFFNAANRLVRYSESFRPPLPFRIVVDPGSKEVVKGASVRVTVRLEPDTPSSTWSAEKLPAHIVLASKPAGQVRFDERTLVADAAGVFSYEFPSLKSSTSYMVKAEDLVSDEYTLTVIDRPMVKMLRVRLMFPSYTRLAERELDDNVGDVSALKGTRIAFTIEANKPLAEARLLFSDSTTAPLAVNGSRASGTITLNKERQYIIHLRDHQNVASVDPITYTLKLLPDAYPTAQVLVPGTNVDIAENAKLKMLYHIADDYGFSSLRLAYRLVHSRYEQPWPDYRFVTIPLPNGITTEADIAHLWNLKDLALVPEDVVSYYLEVFDNDHISGPKPGRSDVYTLRLPSLEEVFADLDKAHDVSVEGIKEALKQAEQAKKDVEELQQELKKNQHKVDWQQQKKTEEILNKYHEIQKKLDEVNKTIDEMVKKMEKNETLSKETLEKYQELQRLMEELNSPEFAEAMKKMQQAMMQFNPELMRQAMQQFQFNEENFRKSIERTMNLLKRIQIEQKVDEMVKRTEEMLKKQEDLQKQTERTNPSDKQSLENLAQQQQELKEQLDRLRKELAELEQKMKEFPTEMPLQEVSDAQTELDRAALEKLMDEIAQQMQHQDVQQAMQRQQSTMQKMGSFMQRMQAMKQALQQNQQRQIVNEMRRALQDLLNLSQRQEALKNQSRQLEPNSQQFRDNTQAQMEILRDLANVTQGLSKLSQKTFAITPEMGKAIGDAMRQMSQAMQSLDQRNSQQAATQQQGAMGSLNEASQMLQSAMQGMMQGGGQGMGMAGFMQRLQQLTGQQQGINQGTQSLQGMSQQQLAELGRLAAEQGMVRKSLEQLAKEAAQSGELSKMLGDLNKIAQEMREVQTDLAQGNVNPETLKKQERILSRLLDSQRSARERDFEKKRRAETGTNVTRRSPVELDMNTLEGRRTKLQQDLQKSIEEGYAKDYQELIKRYYEALEKTQPEQ